MKNNIYIDELKAIYIQEINLAATLPTKIKSTTCQETALAFAKHLQFVKQHLKRLDEIFASIGESAIIINYNPRCHSINL